MTPAKVLVILILSFGLLSCAGAAKMRPATTSYRLVFQNNGGVTTQIAVIVGNNGINNFQLPSGAQDDRMTADPGQVITWWWRDDTSQVQQCGDTDPPCGMHQFTMLERDVGLVVPDAFKQTN